MSEGQTFAYRVIRPWAESMCEELAQACWKIEIAGSVRRMRAYCHDIDLVAWPVYHQQGQPDLFGGGIKQTYEARKLAERISGLLGETFRIREGAKIVTFVFRGVPVEVYLAEPNGENFGALLQMRTGPAEFNLKVIAAAAGRGLRYSAGYGIFRGTDRVDDGTEEGIFKAVGMPWVLPDQRDRY